jgi:hypothetical protein
MDFRDLPRRGTRATDHLTAARAPGNSASPSPQAPLRRLALEVARVPLQSASSITVRIVASTLRTSPSLSIIGETPDLHPKEVTKVSVISHPGCLIGLGGLDLEMAVVGLQNT